jgi:hypothetical protein
MGIHTSSGTLFHLGIQPIARWLPTLRLGLSYPVHIWQTSVEMHNHSEYMPDYLDFPFSRSGMCSMLLKYWE